MCDVNEDGEVTVVDARLILRAAIKLDVFTDRQKRIANPTAPDDITVTAARTALRTAIALEPVKYMEK